MSAEMLRECECGCGQPPPLAKASDKTRGYVRGEPIRFVKGHNAKLWTARPVEERFWEKVDTSGDCWLWKAGISHQGYGRFSPTRDKTGAAHRYSYELVNGPIPEGLVIDHLCAVKACVNPSHLEAVTTAENIRRAHPSIVTNRCKYGHEYTPENTGVTAAGFRQCRACARIRSRRRRGVQ
jgi:hypothetical protein